MKSPFSSIYAHEREHQLMMDNGADDKLSGVKIKSYPTLSDLPSASAFGVGVVQTDDTGLFYLSNGINWSDGLGNIVQQDSNGFDDVTITSSKLESFALNGFAYDPIYDNGLPRIASVNVRATGKFAYVNPSSGLDSRSKAVASVKSTPWASVRECYDSLAAGDGAYIAAGTYLANGSGDYPDAFHRIGKQAMNWFGEDGVILQSTATSSPCLYISTALANGAQSYFYNLTVDGQNKK